MSCQIDSFDCRQKNEELEGQLLEQQQQMALLGGEVERLRGDNVALYEKVRYLQSYSAQVDCCCVGVKYLRPAVGLICCTFVFISGP